MEAASIVASLGVLGGCAGGVFISVCHKGVEALRRARRSGGGIGRAEAGRNREVTSIGAASPAADLLKSFDIISLLPVFASV